MNYHKESNTDWADCIDCYWESHGVEAGTTVTYPSLPEPYLNLYFPIASSEKATLKGISSQADFFEMKSMLFGIRLYLRGYFHLHLAPCTEVSNKILALAQIGSKVEVEVAARIAEAASFEERVTLFQSYFAEKFNQPISDRARHISDALQYLISHYKAPSVIQDYAHHSGYAPRTISRWFTDGIGISPKKLARIARFYHSLSILHTPKEPGYYLNFGYYDQAHYIREFKAFAGITPEEYVRMVSG